MKSESLFGNSETPAPFQVFVAGHGGKASRLEPEIDDFGKAHPGLHAVGGQIIHVDITAVAHDQPLLAVEEAKSLRHVVECGVETVGDRACLGLLLPRGHLGRSRPPAFGEQLRPRCDQVYQIAVVGVHHPDQRHQQQTKIQSDADQQSVAGEHEPQRNRKRGEQQREPGGARNASKAIGAADRPHEDEQRDRATRTGVDIFEQRQRP